MTSLQSFLILTAFALLSSANHLWAQNVGIGEVNPLSKLSVKGNFAVGNAFSPLLAPANGAIIESHTVIGRSSYYDSDDLFTSSIAQKFAICGYVTNGRASTTGTTASIMSSALYGYIDGPGGLGLLIDHRSTTDFGGIINSYAAAGTAAFKGDSESNVAHGVMGENPSTGLGYAVYSNGDVYVSTGGLYGPSDRNLKQNIRPYVGGLTQVMSLTPMMYQYRSDLQEKYRFAPDEQIGFLAQEVEEVFPALVRESKLTSMATQSKNSKDNIGVESMDAKAVNYVGLVPVLTSAIQEQQTQIETLKKENAEIKAQLEILMRRVEEK